MSTIPPAAVPPTTLRDVLRATPRLDAVRAARLLAGAARVLAPLHARGAAHGGLTPDRILVAPGDVVSLVAAPPADAGGTPPWPTYLAPEQIDGHPGDARSDVYALGLLGWEMLTGRQPWEGESLYATVVKQREHDLPRLTTVRPGLPRPLVQAIEGALAKHPADRWQSAGELGAELARVPGAVGDAPADAPAMAPAAPAEWRAIPAAPRAAWPGVPDETPQAEPRAVRPPPRATTTTTRSSALAASPPATNRRPAGGTATDDRLADVSAHARTLPGAGGRRFAGAVLGLALAAAIVAAVTAVTAARARGAHPGVTGIESDSAAAVSAAAPLAAGGPTHGASGTAVPLHRNAVGGALPEDSAEPTVAEPVSPDDVDADGGPFGAAPDDSLGARERARAAARRHADSTAADSTRSAPPDPP